MSDYHVDHRPDSTGARLHDVEEVMPDFYTNPEYYTFDEETDPPSRRAILRSRGNPDAPVWMYRAVPPEVYAVDPHIHSGDWVSTSKPYATRHGMHATDPKQDWPVIARRVRARDLTNEGNS